MVVSKKSRQSSASPPPPPARCPNPHRPSGGGGPIESTSLHDHIAQLQAELEAVTADCGLRPPVDSYPPPFDAPPPNYDREAGRPVSAGPTRGHRQQQQQQQRRPPPPPYHFAERPACPDLVTVSTTGRTGSRTDESVASLGSAGGGGGGGGGEGSRPAPRFSAAHVLVALAAAALGAFGGHMGSRHHAAKKLDVELTERTFAALERFTSKRRGSFPEVEELKAQYEEKMASVKRTIEPEDELLRQRDDIWHRGALEMQSYIAKQDYQTAVERHGEGPHRIMFSLRFIGETVGTGKYSHEERRGKIWVETAPLLSMPHSVLTFLDMVSKGMYNGLRFNVMTDGGMLAVDMDNKIRPAASDKVVARFENAGRLPALAFQEDHHEVIPYQKNCVGFLGKGPGIFISVMDDAKHRGEPCFAKVVDGFDIMEKIAALGAGELENPVMISFAKVLSD